MGERISELEFAVSSHSPAELSIVGISEQFPVGFIPEKLVRVGRTSRKTR